MLYHADLTRVGDQCAAPWRPGAPLALNRLQPLFGQADGEARPLADSSLSRRVLSLEPEERALVVRGEGALPYRIAGQTLEGTARLPLALLEEGTLLHCGRGVLLWLECRRSPPEATPSLGLVGVSALTGQVRTRVRQLAGERLPVMITGEADSGRHAVACALHRHGPTPAGPLISATAGALDAERARDAWRRAADGTLVLDDVARLPEPAQAALLRRLAEQERTDGPAVRVVSIASMDPATMVDQGLLSRPLAYRLCTTRIAVAPLRQRPVDVPLLFLAALRARLAPLGTVDRLDAGRAEPWLPRAVIEALLRHGWPGNHRELDNLAQEVALASREGAHAALPTYWQPRPAPDARFVEPSPSVMALDEEHRHWAVPPDELRAALRRHGWRVRAVASELGIARNTIYGMMARLGIRRPSDLTAADILAAVRAVGSTDSARVAEHLEISERGLKLRMHALDLTLE